MGRIAKSLFFLPCYQLFIQFMVFKQSMKFKNFITYRWYVLSITVWCRLNLTWWVHRIGYPCLFKSNHQKTELLQMGVLLFANDALTMCYEKFSQTIFRPTGLTDLLIKLTTFIEKLKILSKSVDPTSQICLEFNFNLFSQSNLTYHQFNFWQFSRIISLWRKFDSTHFIFRRVTDSIGT